MNARSSNGDDFFPDLVCLNVASLTRSMRSIIEDAYLRHSDCCVKSKRQSSCQHVTATEFTDPVPQTRRMYVSVGHDDAFPPFTSHSPYPTELADGRRALDAASGTA